MPRKLNKGNISIEEMKLIIQNQRLNSNRGFFNSLPRPSLTSDWKYWKEYRNDSCIILPSMTDSNGNVVNPKVNIANANRIIHTFLFSVLC